MSNMENAHSEDMQFDDTDLSSACSAKQVPPQKPVQTLGRTQVCLRLSPKQ